MQRYIDRGQVAGSVTVLARRGQVAHVGISGQLDFAAARPMREDAIFRIFSMTKPITSLAVLMLYEEGLFHLQYPISLFIAGFNGLKVLKNQMDTNSEKVALEHPITIHDLLTHTSGLGYGLDALMPVDALMLQAKMLRVDETLVEKCHAPSSSLCTTNRDCAIPTASPPMYSVSWLRLSVGCLWMFSSTSAFSNHWG